MAGLPKWIIKKYGMTKRAWQVFRGKKTTSRATTYKPKAKTRVIQHMARKSRVKRYARAAGNKMMNGLYKPTGMIENALLGIGAAAALDKFAPSIDFAYKHEAAAFVVGGIPGAAAVFLLKGGIGASSNNSDLN